MPACVPTGTQPRNRNLANPSCGHQSMTDTVLPPSRGHLCGYLRETSACYHGARTPGACHHSLYVISAYPGSCSLARLSDVVRELFYIGGMTVPDLLAKTRPVRPVCMIGRSAILTNPVHREDGLPVDRRGGTRLMGAVSSSPISSPTRQRERAVKRFTSPPAPRCSGSTPHTLMTAPSTVLVSGRCPMGTGRIAEKLDPLGWPSPMPLWPTGSGTAERRIQSERSAGRSAAATSEAADEAVDRVRRRWRARSWGRTAARIVRRGHSRAGGQDIQARHARCRREHKKGQGRRPRQLPHRAMIHSYSL